MEVSQSENEELAKSSTQDSSDSVTNLKTETKLSTERASSDKASDKDKDIDESPPKVKDESPPHPGVKSDNENITADCLTAQDQDKASLTGSCEAGESQKMPTPPPEESSKTALHKDSTSEPALVEDCKVTAPEDSHTSPAQDSDDSIMEIDDPAPPADKPDATLAGGGDSESVPEVKLPEGGKEITPDSKPADTAQRGPPSEDVEMSEVIPETTTDKPTKTANESTVSSAETKTPANQTGPDKLDKVDIPDEEKADKSVEPNDADNDKKADKDDKPDTAGNTDKPEKTDKSKKPDKAGGKDIDLVTLDSDSDEPASPTKPGAGLASQGSASVGGSGTSRPPVAIPRGCLNPDCKTRDGLLAAVSSDLVYFTMVHGESSTLPTQLRADGRRAKICKICRLLVDKYNKVGGVGQWTLAR